MTSKIIFLVWVKISIISVDHVSIVGVEKGGITALSSR